MIYSVSRTPCSYRAMNRESTNLRPVFQLIVCLLIMVPVAHAQAPEPEFFEDADDLSEETDSPPVAVVAPPELASIEDAFAKEFADLKIATDQRKLALATNYSKALNRLLQNVTESGELEAVVEVRDEIRRVSEKIEPRAGDRTEIANAELRELYEKFAGAHDAIVVAAVPALRNLHQKRATAIRAKVQELTKSGNLGAAMAANKFLESVQRDLPSPPLPRGYDLFYTFEDVVEGSRDVKDQSPSGNDSRSNASGYEPAGKRGAGYRIEQSPHHLYLKPEPPLAEDAFTIAAWVNLTRYGKYARLWDRIDARRKVGYGITFLEGRPRFEYFDRLRNKQECVSPKVLSLGTWHHVIVTYDKTRCVIYVDGETTLNTGSRPMNQGKRHVRVGLEASGGSLRLGGKIDDLIHYPRALSKPEALTLFQAVSGGS